MNEKYLKYAADEKYIIAATIILLLISGLFYFGYSSTKKERILLENKNNILENWTEDESMIRHEEFFKIFNCLITIYLAKSKIQVFQ